MVTLARFGDRVRAGGFPAGLVVEVRARWAEVEVPLQDDDGAPAGSITLVCPREDLEILERAGFDAGA